jgi:hypothetical protein
MEFIHEKEFVTNSGEIITMKALVTIHGQQFIECYENNIRYKVEELQELQEIK